MSFILTITFILFAIIFRLLKQYHLTGNFGVRFVKTDAPFFEKFFGITFLLSFLNSIIFIVLIHFQQYPWQVYPPVTHHNIIALIGFSGILITVLAQWQMGVSWRIGVDKTETTELITSGIFTHSRNPIYFGIFLYWFAIILDKPQPILILSALTCWLSIEVIVRKVEEPYLLKVHGEKYTIYYKNTHRYFIFSIT